MSPVVDVAFPGEVRREALPEVLERLQQGLSARPLAFHERLLALNALSDVLLRGGASASVPGGAFLAGFLRASNLERLLARELPAPAALDRFVATDDRKSVRLLPRGLVCHWIAGNVPLLGMFSWAASALVGNANLVRLSSRQDDVVTPLLQMLAATGSPGRQMALTTAVVQFDRDDRAAHAMLSRAADVRIAWGGLEAVEAIRDLPARWDCETIAFGPRISLAVVDPVLATDRVLTRLATDVIYFDQLACSSPQCLFVKGRPGAAEFDAFLERFTRAFAAQARSVPRHPLDWGETYRILLDRTRVVLNGGSVAADDGTSWTVALVERPQPAVTCANRFLQVIPFDSLEDVYPHIPSNVQTMVTLVPDGELDAFTEAAAARGVCRFPRPGDGNGFESPWDGVPLISRLVRWVVRTDAPRPGARQSMPAVKHVEEQNG
jgi:hypothetical protein